MPNRSWRTSLGIVAVLLWSAVIGLPVLVFHVNTFMDAGEHIHAFFMFVASQVLVFWLAARHPRSTPRTSRALVLVAPPQLPIPSPFQIWDAELVAEGEARKPASAPTGAADPGGAIPQDATAADRRPAKLIVANYLGSSRPRAVSVEPGSAQRTLLPGHELEITAAPQGAPVAFRIVESDLMTQVYVEGVQEGVSVTPRSPGGQEIRTFT